MTSDWEKQLWSCVAHPCTKKRAEGSAFCELHKKKKK